jgi:hypothetical protein
MNLGLNAEKRHSNFFIIAGLMIMLMAMICICLGSAQEGYNASQAMISKDEAARMIIDTLVKNLTENSDLKMGLQVNQYPELLDAGTEVREATAGGAMPSRVLVCQNASWLFFLDLAPRAHFAHPTIIAVIDAVSGEIQTMDAEWWPVLAKPVFDNETQRRDPQTIIFEKEANL